MICWLTHSLDSITKVIVPSLTEGYRELLPASLIAIG
jgi:hypothetical protein